MCSSSLVNYYFHSRLLCYSARSYALAKYLIHFQARTVCTILLIFISHISRIFDAGSDDRSTIESRDMSIMTEDRDVELCKTFNLKKRAFRAEYCTVGNPYNTAIYFVCKRHNTKRYGWIFRKQTGYGPEQSWVNFGRLWLAVTTRGGGMRSIECRLVSIFIVWLHFFYYISRES